MGGDYDTGAFGQWSGPETDIWLEALDQISGFDPDVADQIAADTWAQLLYHESMFDLELPADQREAIYQAFSDYMEANYDIDWGEIVDWEAYREAYDAA